MARMKYRVKTPRGPNAVNARPQRLTSVDGKRWATGRNVKRHEANHRYSIIEAWTLKERMPDGKAWVVSSHKDREEAERWVAREPISWGVIDPTFGTGADR